MKLKEFAPSVVGDNVIAVKGKTSVGVASSTEWILILRAAIRLNFSDNLFDLIECAKAVVAYIVK